MKESKMTKKKEKSEDDGVSLDDAFGDDENVEYAQSKPKKQKKKSKDKDIEEELDEEIEEAEEEIEGIEKEINGGEDIKIEIKVSKPIGKIKKGDRIRVDDKELEVDEHYVMIDHGSTKEMVIELFNPVNEKDYQLRYFDDQVEESIGFFELEEIVYVRRKVKRIEW